MRLAMVLATEAVLLKGLGSVTVIQEVSVQEARIQGASARKVDDLVQEELPSRCAAIGDP